MILVLSLLLTAAPEPVPPAVEKFLHDNHITMEQACRAVKRFKIVKFDLPKCVVGEEGITEIRDTSGCKTHYTLYERGHDVICQCNRGGEHSEVIALDVTHDMNNLKFPCLRRCYPTMLKELISHHSMIIRLTYKRVDSDSAKNVHEAFLKHCDEWTED